MKRAAPTSLRGLRTFCVAARYESFKAAADALFITPSAVSQQVKNLEQELGLRLFERGARQVRLTHFGEAFALRVRDILGQVEDLGDFARTL